MLQLIREWVVKKFLGNIVTGDFIIGIVKSIAEGKFGAPLKGVYWALAGKKRWIAILIAVVYTVLLNLDPTVCPTCEKYAEIVYGSVAVLITLGLFDSAVRIEPPKK